MYIGSSLKSNHHKLAQFRETFCRNGHCQYLFSDGVGVTPFAFPASLSQTTLQHPRVGLKVVIFIALQSPEKKNKTSCCQKMMKKLTKQKKMGKKSLNMCFVKGDRNGCGKRLLNPISGFKNPSLTDISVWDP